jgi:acetyl-CoA decarbonylase/synthase complex subunit gamma
MKAALAKVADRRPLVYGATSDNVTEMAALAKENNCPLAVHGADLAEAAEVAEQAAGAGMEEIVLDPGVRDFAGTLSVFTQIRRLALKGERSVGYPTIGFPGEGTESPEEETLLAAQQIAKYAGIVVLDHFAPHDAYVLLTERLNLFTDPQRPIQVEAGIYEIREPSNDSPVLVTTNFSLSYFAAMGETEGSGFPAYLVVCDTDGQSVLTAWAAAKLDGEVIAKAITSTEVADRVNHRYVIIPGHVAVLSGEIEEELPGWSVLVGPREATDIPNFLRNIWTARLQEAKA